MPKGGNPGDVIDRKVSQTYEDSYREEIVEQKPVSHSRYFIEKTTKLNGQWKKGSRPSQIR